MKLASFFLSIFFLIFLVGISWLPCDAIEYVFLFLWAVSRYLAGEAGNLAFKEHAAPSGSMGRPCRESQACAEPYGERARLRVRASCLQEFRERPFWQ